MPDNHHNVSSYTAAAERLEEFLKSTEPRQLERTTCCNTSRSLYCSECCTVLIPREDWPKPIQDRKLRLPFNVHILLDKKERRGSSTGVQLTAIYRSMMLGVGVGGGGESASKQKCNQQEDEEEDINNNYDNTVLEVSENNRRNGPTYRSTDAFGNSVELYDLATTEIPNYNLNNDNNNGDDDYDYSGTFVLFPAKGSVPVSSVASKIKTLVVLDMKWSSQNVKMDRAIAALPKVHLDSPPAQSHFWRWHTSGKGMLSTIEAIYFAAIDAASVKWKENGEDNDSDDDGGGEEQRENLIQIMWLFALQYAVIHVRSEEKHLLLPFTEEGKERNRALRKQRTGNPTKKRINIESFYKELS